MTRRAERAGNGGATTRVPDAIAGVWPFIARGVETRRAERAGNGDATTRVPDAIAGVWIFGARRMPPRVDATAAPRSTPRVAASRSARAAVAVLTLVGALAGFVVLGARSAGAQDPVADTVAHRVRPGDTLELLAAEFYGDRTKAVFIMVENKLAHARALRPGERLRIPVSREVASSPGDTFESLAGLYLGSARRGVFLAEFNGMSADDGVPAGTVVTVPLTIAHTAASSESLADIARAYLGDGRKAELLRRYNFLEKGAIDKGESLIVPASHVKLTAQKMLPLDADAKARRDHRRDAVARAAKALPAARQAWKAGDYAAVRSTLAGLEADLDYLDTADAVEVGVLLGAAHVAFDEGEPAMTVFKRVIDRSASHVLRRYECSPKILDVWQKAGGLIE